MVPNLKDLDLEATTRDKVLFVIVVLPLLGVLGGALRVFAGVSEPAMLMVVIPLQCAAFVAWHLGIATMRARRNAAEGGSGTWPPRDPSAPPYIQQQTHVRPE